MIILLRPYCLSCPHFQDTRLLLSRDSDGVSPILKAAKLGHLNIVNLILTKLPQAVKSADKATLEYDSLELYLLFFRLGGMCCIGPAGARTRS